MGTLEEIIAAGHEVSLVVTQPDKPKGRGKEVQFSPVKEAALAHGIEVYQPKRVREPEHVSYLAKYQPDIIVVAAFGQILPKEILDMPEFGCSMYMLPSCRSTGGSTDSMGGHQRGCRFRRHNHANG